MDVVASAAICPRARIPETCAIKWNEVRSETPDPARLTPTLTVPSHSAVLLCFEYIHPSASIHTRLVVVVNRHDRAHRPKIAIFRLISGISMASKGVETVRQFVASLVDDMEAALALLPPIDMRPNHGMNEAGFRAALCVKLAAFLKGDAPVLEAVTCDEPLKDHAVFGKERVHAFHRGQQFGDLVLYLRPSLPLVIHIKSTPCHSLSYKSTDAKDTWIDHLQACLRMAPENAKNTRYLGRQNAFWTALQTFGQKPNAHALALWYGAEEPAAISELLDRHVDDQLLPSMRALLKRLEQESPVTVYGVFLHHIGPYIYTSGICSTMTL